MTDTVGFIQKLPTQLVAAFRATLEEIKEAALLVHVVDVSHPNAAAQTQAVMQVRSCKLAKHCLTTDGLQSYAAAQKQAAMQVMGEQCWAGADKIPRASLSGLASSSACTQIARLHPVCTHAG